eukprot:6190432-Pleurochrysis_carterae.AAC.1
MGTRDIQHSQRNRLNERSRKHKAAVRASAGSHRGRGQEQGGWHGGEGHKGTKHSCAGTGVSTWTIVCDGARTGANEGTRPCRGSRLNESVGLHADACEAKAVAALTPPSCVEHVSAVDGGARALLSTASRAPRPRPAPHSSAQASAHCKVGRSHRTAAG